MEVIRGKMVHALVNRLTDGSDVEERIKVTFAVSNNLVGPAIHQVNLATGNRRQLYNGELVELIFDHIEGKIVEDPGLKIGYTGKILTRVNLAEALDDIRENYLREKV